MLGQVVRGRALGRLRAGEFIVRTLGGEPTAVQGEHDTGREHGIDEPSGFSDGVPARTRRRPRTVAPVSFSPNVGTSGCVDAERLHEFRAACDERIEVRPRRRASVLGIELDDADGRATLGQREHPEPLLCLRHEEGLALAR